MLLFGKVDGEHVFLFLLFVCFIGKCLQKAWNTYDKEGKIIDSARETAQDKLKEKVKQKIEKGDWKFW